MLYAAYNEVKSYRDPFCLTRGCPGCLGCVLFL